MSLAIVLPRNSRFDEAHPNSMDTVVRTINTASAYRDDVIIIADAGAQSHGVFRVETVQPGLRRARRTRYVIDLLRALRPRLVELHQVAPQASRIARALPAVPTIFYRHNFSKVPSGWVRRFKYDWIYRAFDARVFVSGGACEAFRSGFPKLADATHAIPNPVDPDLWRAPVGVRDPVIAFAGRAAPEKGFGELCAALPAVLARHPAWRAVLYGSAWDTHAAWAERQVRPLAAFGDRVTVARDQPIASVRALLKRAAIAVVPSVRAEAFGLAAVEAHMAGAALVSSGTGGLREASGPHARYVGPITPDTLADAIGDLIGDPEHRARLAAQGQRFALATHTPARRAAQLDAIRTGLLAETARTDRRRLS